MEFSRDWPGSVDRRRRLVLSTWIVGGIAVAFVGFNFGAASDNDYSGGNSDSAKAQALIEKHFPEQQGDTLTLAIKAEKGIDDPAVRQKIEKVVADLDASPISPSSRPPCSAPTSPSSREAWAWPSPCSSTPHRPDGPRPRSDGTVRQSQLVDARTPGTEGDHGCTRQGREEASV